jgi:hypothetical protein
MSVSPRTRAMVMQTGAPTPGIWQLPPGQQMRGTQDNAIFTQA